MSSTAVDVYKRQGVDGVMIGRATYGRPWIFRAVKHYLSTGEAVPQPSVEERVAVAKEHLQKSLDIKGDHVGILEMRRHMTNYFCKCSFAMATRSATDGCGSASPVER